jgi:hypothetical protein
MEQDIKRTGGKLASVKCPRIKRTVDDEYDYADEDADQTFIVTTMRA